MKSIKSVPDINPETGLSDFNLKPFWSETSTCAGFTLPEDCPWRDEEMQLITFTPLDCYPEYQKLEGCRYLVAYARIQKRNVTQNEAIWNFSTTVFTCAVLTTLFIIFN